MWPGQFDTGWWTGLPSGTDSIISSAQQTFSDVPNTHPFWLYIERVGPVGHGVVNGYSCGQPPAGPCDAQQRPYYLPSNDVTRGQTTKFIANAFFPNCTTPLDR